MPEKPDVGELVPPDRTLMGPGPSEVHPRVLRSMSTPLLGHLDPSFLDLMDDTQALLRYVFRTDNRWTIPVSGTGSAAMETAVCNLVEPGETVLVPGNGYFGGRMGEMARRAGGEVVTVDAPWGEPLAPSDVAAAFDEHQPAVFGFVHGETSTGVRQPDVADLAGIAHDHDALVVVDTVASLGGVEFETDAWDVDVVYSGAQKCLSCPPGASPLTANERAMAKILDREEPTRSWYLDLSLLEGYWGDERSYHHTAPITNVYALREALRLVAEEGLETGWDRHARVSGGMKAGLAAMGLESIVDETAWLPSLNAIRLPAGVDDGTVTAHLLDEYGIEVAGGLGDLAGEILRIGCMGYSARAETVLSLLAGLGDALESAGASVDPAGGVAAAQSELVERS